jgi:hypothetical protein
MDQSVRSRLANMHTMPKGAANYDIRPVASSDSSADPTHN